MQESLLPSCGGCRQPSWLWLTCQSSVSHTCYPQPRASSRCLLQQLLAGVPSLCQLRVGSCPLCSPCPVEAGPLPSPAALPVCVPGCPAAPSAAACLGLPCSFSHNPRALQVVPVIPLELQPYENSDNYCVIKETLLADEAAGRRWIALPVFPQLAERGWRVAAVTA